MPIFHRYTVRVSIAALALGATAGFGAHAADGGVKRVAGGLVITPPSNFSAPGFMHTNFEIFVPNGRSAFASQPSGKYETPASLACVYGLTKMVAGCNPETLTTVATGGSKVVVIVDAYDYPTAQSDLSVYSQQFGLPPITDQNFQVVYASGTQPQQDSTGGWEFEEALDLDMSHALAPDAKIVLVEAASNSTNDLLQAEDVATKIAMDAGGGTVSNSWSGGEFAKEEGTEKRFAGTNVVYFASSGDSAGTGWPATLSNVVSVGGTYIDRDTNGKWLGDQTSWPGSGGGHSQYVPRPSYQDSVKKRVGATRGIPDVSLDASPGSGVWVYDTNPYRGQVPNWATTGGTSVSSPAVAAIINNAGAFANSTPAELAVVYKNRKNPSDWTDIVSGACNNPKSGGQATKGYDFCTGVGTPLGLSGK